MLKKHRKTSSIPLLCCDYTKSSQASSILVDKNSLKAEKLSLKQFAYNKSQLDKPLLFKKTINQNKTIQFQNRQPNIKFTYSTPIFFQDIQKTLQPIVLEKVQYQHKNNFRVKTQVEKICKQRNFIKAVSKRMYHKPNFSELNLVKQQQKTNTFERQKEEIHSLQTQKMKHCAAHEQEIKTVNYQRQEKKKRDGLQIELDNKQSLFIRQNSQSSQSGYLQRKTKYFYSSQNFQETMKKLKKGNNIYTTNDFLQRKQKRLNNRTVVQLNREVYRKGKLFEKASKLQINYSDNDDQLSSSHYSEVIQDYKSLLGKLKYNKLQDSQSRQI